MFSELILFESVVLAPALVKLSSRVVPTELSFDCSPLYFPVQILAGVP